MKKVCLYSIGDPKGPEHWPWIYFHGDCEQYVDESWNTAENRWEAPDLISGDTPLESLEDGIHNVLVYGKEAKLYLWTEEKISSGVTFYGNGLSEPWYRQMRRGLVCLIDDKKNCTHAQKLMEEKAEFL